MPTSLASFKEGFYARPGEHPDRPTNCTAPLFTFSRITVTLAQGGVPPLAETDPLICPK